MYCDECGGEIEDGSRFCEHCGASLGGEAAIPGPETEAEYLPGAATPIVPSYAPAAAQGAPATPPPPSTSPMGEWGAQAQPYPPLPGAEPSLHASATAAAGKSKLVPVLVAACALLVVGVVVVVLMLTVFKEKGTEKAGEDAVPTPSAAAEACLKALEDRDLGALLALIDPAFVEDLKDEYGKEYKSILEGYFLDPLPEGVEFSGLEFSEEVKGDRAEVTLVKGRATYRDESGKKVTEDLTETIVGTLKLLRKKGKWYLDMKGFEGSFEDYLADYDGGGGGKDGSGEKKGKGKKTFMSPQIGISFDYPENWVAKEYPEGLVEVTPAGAEEEARATFYTEDLSGVEYALEDWIASETGELEAQGWPYEVTRKTVAGIPAAQITFTYLGEQSYGDKVMDTIFISGNTAYVVSYIALEEVFGRYLDAAQKMIESLRLVMY